MKNGQQVAQQVHSGNFETNFKQYIKTYFDIKLRNTEKSENEN